MKEVIQQTDSPEKLRKHFPGNNFFGLKPSQFQFTAGAMDSILKKSIVSLFCICAVSLSACAEQIKVGFFIGDETASEAKAYATRMCNSLKQYDQFETEYFSTFENISQYNVIFISGAKVGSQSPCWKELIIKYTANGGAVILMGASTGYPIEWEKEVDYCPPLFECAFMRAMWCDDYPFASTQNEYNIFEEELDWGTSGRYETLTKGTYGVELLHDNKHKPVVIAGAFGKGKVVGIGPVLGAGAQPESLQKYMQTIFIWAGTPWAQTPVVPAEIEEYINNAQLKLDGVKNDETSNKDAFLKRLNK